MQTSALNDTVASIVPKLSSRMQAIKTALERQQNLSHVP